MERLVSEMTCNVLIGTLNPTHSLTFVCVIHTFTSTKGDCVFAFVCLSVYGDNSKNCGQIVIKFFRDDIYMTSNNWLDFGDGLNSGA